MNDQKTDLGYLEAYANRLRRHVIEMAYCAGASSAHIGGALSIVDILAVLYSKVLRYDKMNPEWMGRDRFILSKGHACLAYYAALSEVGYITDLDMKTFEETNSILLGHPVMNRSKGIEVSSGSLGMGFSLGVGVAVAGKKRNQGYHVYVVIGDGECNEGSIWESAMSSAHFKLDNLTVILDKNDFQQTGSTETILSSHNLGQKWQSFGWNTIEIDGHNFESLRKALKTRQVDKPTAIVAQTIKGKGVSIFENDNAWHHGVLNSSNYEIALSELS